MQKFIFYAYLVFTLLVLAASIYLPIDNFFSVEYVLLGIQAAAAFYYYAKLAKTAENKRKYENIISLIVIVSFIGILYYATFHILVLGLSGMVLGGWFLVQKYQGN